MKRKFSLRLQVAVFTFIRMSMNISIRMIYPFISVFARGLGVDLVGMSRAISIRSLVGSFSPLLTTIADRRGRKTGMMVATLMFFAGASTMFFWHSYIAFVIALCLTTLGLFLYFPSMQAYISDHVPYERRGRVLAVIEMGWALSFILGMPLIALVIERFDWAAPFYLLAGLGFISIILLWWMIPSTAPQPENNGRKALQNLGTVLTSKSAMAALLMGLLFSAGNEVISVVFGYWLEDSFGLRLGALGAASAVIGFAELSGETLTAGLVDRLGKKRSIWIGLVLNGIFSMVLPWMGQTLPGALVGLFLFFLTFEFTIVSSLPMMTEILPSARATLLGINAAALSVGRGLGAWLSPVLFVSGIWANGIGALVLNMIAMIALSQVRIHESGQARVD